MTQDTRPRYAVAFTGALVVAAVGMIWIGGIAMAFYCTIPALLAAAFLTFTGKAPKFLKAILVINHVAGLTLVAAVAYRNIAQPHELATLTISGIGLIGNMLFGGPALSLIAMPMLALGFRKA